MIDWNRVNELRDEIGEEDFAEVVEIFLEEVEGEIANLKDRTDQTDLESMLHFLKGSALNLGFLTFSQLCHQGETEAAMDEGREIDFDKIFRCYDASKSEFLNALPSVDAA